MIPDRAERQYGQALSLDIASCPDSGDPDAALVHGELWRKLGDDEVSKVAFGRALTDKGYPVDQGTHDRLRRGICLRDREGESAGR